MGDRGDSEADGERPAPVGVSSDTGTDPLATRRRRVTLRVLAAHRLLASLGDDAGPVVLDLAETVDGVAERERADPDVAVGEPRAHRRAVAAALRFDHLPALDEAGVVEFDPHAETVAYGGDPAVETELSLSE